LQITFHDVLLQLGVPNYHRGYPLVRICVRGTFGGEAVPNLRVLFTQIRSRKNTKANDAMRIALGLGHLFPPFVAMLIYHYLYIWREDLPAWVAARTRKVEELRESTAS